MARFVLTYANAHWNFPVFETISTTIQIWKLETRIGIEHTTILFIKILLLKLNVYGALPMAQQHPSKVPDVRLDIRNIHFINFKLYI